MEDQEQGARGIITGLLTAVLFLAGLALMLADTPGAVDDTANGSPIDWHSNVRRNFGAFLSVTIALGFLYKAFVSKRDEARRVAQFRRIIDDKLDSTFAGCVRHGLEAFVDDIDFRSIFDGLGADQTLWWLDTYDPSYMIWEDSLKRAIDRGASFRFLVMKPQQSLAQMRAEELDDRYSVDDFNDELAKFLRILRSVERMTAGARGDIAIVEYTDLPCAPMYVVAEDDQAVHGYSSMFLGKATAIEFPHLHWVRSKGPLLDAMLMYMQEKWKRNAPSEVEVGA